jgi:hypothetical protein
MAAYVASARIDHGRPRIVGPAGLSIRLPAEPPERRTATASASADDPAAPAAAEPWVLDTSPPGQRDLELRWEGVKERWSQLWFFVLDPQSWR